VVDLTEKCIEACKSRFKNVSNINYFVNDGKSLDMIQDNSIDFVFSWDSLVHVEKDVIQAYLKELSKKLTTNGVGFIHHSNLAVYKDKKSDEITVENKHWRASSVSAELFEKYASDVGLQCICQEKINWGDIILNDCFSVITRKNSTYSRPNLIVENTKFNEEMNHSLYISKYYNMPTKNKYEFTEESLIRRMFKNLRIIE